MDEATSALDNATERSIIGSLERLARAKTIIMVAHRLSTVKNCDRMYLVQSGQIVDSGTYYSLAERHPEMIYGAPDRVPGAREAVPPAELRGRTDEGLREPSVESIPLAYPAMETITAE